MSYRAWPKILILQIHINWHRDESRVHEQINHPVSSSDKVSLITSCTVIFADGKMEIGGELGTISPLLPPIPSERFYSCQASYYPLIVRPLSKMYAKGKVLSLRFYRWPDPRVKIFQGAARMEITSRIVHARYRNGGQLFSRCISSNSCALEDGVDAVEVEIFAP